MMCNPYSSTRPKSLQTGFRKEFLICIKFNYIEWFTLARIAGAGYFRAKKEISRTRKGRKGEEASSPLRVFPSRGL